MAKTEKAKTYEGAVTIYPKTIERLQTIADQNDDNNRKIITLIAQTDLTTELAKIKGRGQTAQEARISTRQEIEDLRDYHTERLGSPEWTVTHSDESTTTGMTAIEVLALNNMNTRQISGIRLTGGARTFNGGTYFRYDTREGNGVSQISVTVEGPDDQVNVLFDKLQGIAMSSLGSSKLRTFGSIFSTQILLFVSVVLLGISFSSDLLSDVPPEIQTYVLAGGIVLYSFAAVFAVRPVLEFFSPSWNCRIGDGEARAAKVAARRQAWMQYGFGAIVLGLVVGFVVNYFSQK